MIVHHCITVHTLATASTAKPASSKHDPYSSAEDDDSEDEGVEDYKKGRVV